MSATAEHLLTLQEDSLPPGWKLATIEGLVGKGGVFIDGDWVESKDQDPEGDVRLIQLADVGDGEYRNKSARFLTYERAILLGCTFLQKGDVLIARMPDPLGRACIFPGDSKPAVTVVDVAIVRSANGEFNHRWLMYFVNAPAFRAAVASMQSGSTRKRISRGNLSKISLPVPPLDQQKRIVAEIEKQFSRLDEAVANLKRVKANLKRYKAAVLKAAVEGRLVETEAELARREGRGYETGAQLLQRILETRRSQWKGKGKYKEPAAPDTADLPELPEGWAWGTIEQLVSELMNGYGKRSQAAGRPRIVLRLADVTDGEISYADVRRINCTNDETRKYVLARNDLLILRVNGSPELVGRFVLLRHTAEEALFCDHFIRVRCAVPNLAVWLRIYADTKRFRRYIDLNKVSSAGQNTINQGALLPFAMPFPPAEEQQRIVKEIARRLSLVCEVEVQVDANLKRAERLRQSILIRAFSGRLDTQELPYATEKSFNSAISRNAP